MNDTINVCLATDDNYCKHAGVAIASILANAENKDNLNFYILDGKISEKHKQQISALKSIKDCQINFIPVDEEIFNDYKAIKIPQHIKLTTFYRLKISSLLPEVNKIIYLDCDTVVNRSLARLYEQELGENILGGVKDIGKKLRKNNPDYINAGMMIMDLDKIRKYNIEDLFLQYTKENKNNIKYGDQDIINNVCKGKIKILDDRWNVQSSNFTNRSSYTKNPYIIHFIAKRKPWHYASFSYHKDYYFKYLQLTPWKLDEKELKHWTKDNKIASIIGYIKYRPFFMFRPRFYKALFYTYFNIEEK